MNCSGGEVCAHPGPDSTRVAPTQSAPPGPPGSARGPDRRKLDARAAARALRGAPSHPSATCRSPPAPRPRRDAPAPTAARSAQAPPRGSGRRERQAAAGAASASAGDSGEGGGGESWRRGAGGGEGDGDAGHMRRRPAGRAEARRRRRLRGNTPPGEGRPQGGLRSGQGAGPGGAGELVGRPEEGGTRGTGVPGRVRRGGGRGCCRDFPPTPEGRLTGGPPLPPALPPPLSLGALFPNWEGNGQGVGPGGGGRAGRAGTPEDPGRALGRRSAVLATPRGG